MQNAARTSNGAAEAYTFQNPPQEFNPQYRDPSGQRNRYGNIMYDRRVYRGNTYASPVMSSGARAELDQHEAEEALRRKQAMQRAAAIKRRKQLDAARRKLATPDPVAGRQHIEMQTEEYLEELTDPIPMETQETQTDPLMDRPPTPKYAPQKTGRDAETQIHEGDLFHFDDAVEPILEVMVGKTLEQAMLEVMQEDELELLRQQQLEFEQRRKEELLEAQRLESMEKRKFEEKERRKKQEMERIQREKETREKLQARQFAKVYMTNLENRGWFSDRVLNEVELEFMPWLMSEMDKELEKKRQARALVDTLIRQVVTQNVGLVEQSVQSNLQATHPEEEVLTAPPTSSGERPLQAPGSILPVVGKGAPEENTGAPDPGANPNGGQNPDDLTEQEEPNDAAAADLCRREAGTERKREGKSSVGGYLHFYMYVSVFPSSSLLVVLVLGSGRSAYELPSFPYPFRMDLQLILLHRRGTTILPCPDAVELHRLREIDWHRHIENEIDRLWINKQTNKQTIGLHALGCFGAWLEARAVSFCVSYRTVSIVFVQLFVELVVVVVVFKEKNVTASISFSSNESMATILFQLVPGFDDPFLVGLFYSVGAEKKGLPGAEPFYVAFFFAIRILTSWCFLFVCCCLDFLFGESLCTRVYDTTCGKK
eukprot:gene8750-6154_t